MDDDSWTHANWAWYNNTPKIHRYRFIAIINIYVKKLKARAFPVLKNDEKLISVQG